MLPFLITELHFSALAPAQEIMAIDEDHDGLDELGVVVDLFGTSMFFLRDLDNTGSNGAPTLIGDSVTSIVVLRGPKGEGGVPTPSLDFDPEQLIGEFSLTVDHTIGTGGYTPSEEVSVGPIGGFDGSVDIPDFTLVGHGVSLTGPVQLSTMSVAFAPETVVLHDPVAGKLELEFTAGKIFVSADSIKILGGYSGIQTKPNGQKSSVFGGKYVIEGGSP